LSPGGNVMIPACQGCSNVGRLSNAADVDLTREGLGKTFARPGWEGTSAGLCSPPRACPRRWMCPVHIRSIPVQVFYDENGDELFRQAGFYAEPDVLKQIEKPGVES